MLPAIVKDLEEQVDRELTRPEVVANLPGQLDNIGCIKGFVENGVPENFRNNVWFRVSTLAAAAGASRDQLDAKLETYAASCTKEGHDGASSLVSEFDGTTGSGMKQAGRPDAPRRSCSWLRFNVTEAYCNPGCPMLKAREGVGPIATHGLVGVAKNGRGGETREMNGELDAQMNSKGKPGGKEALNSLTSYDFFSDEKGDGAIILFHGHH